MKKLLLTVLFLFVIPITSTFGARLASLYQAEVPVASQTEDLKQQAISNGLLQILVKLSGDPKISTNPIIKSSLKKGDYYVQEYSYTTSTPDASQYMLQIRYDANDVNRLLKKAGIAYWGENRPLLLVWLAVSGNESSTEIIGSETPGVEYNSMKQQSKKFGIPLILPIMDVADITQVSASDITSMSFPVLKEAAKRYSPDALLIGTIEKNSNEIHSKWQLVLDHSNWNWTITGKTSDDVIAVVMNQISQTLAKNYIVKSADAQEQWLKVEVSNITQSDDLAQLMQYLKQLTPVEQVDLSQVSGDVVELSVLIQGSLAAFQKNASIGQRLVLKSQDDSENKLVYEWVH